MGLTLSNLMELFPFIKKEVRILMLGLDNAGKTTILYKLKLGEVEYVIPTIGFNIETIEHKNLKLTVWDIGGGRQARQLWRHYFVENSALIFVVDSADLERLDEAAEELHIMMKAFETKDIVLLVFANKQDLPNALDLPQLIDRLKLQELKQMWYLHPACANDGTGLREGLNKLSQMLKQKSWK